jgi:hypothetical protein
MVRKQLEGPPNFGGCGRLPFLTDHGRVQRRDLLLAKK